MKYRLELDGKDIGETNFEFGDPPMGVVFGSAKFSFKESPYRFLLSYCESNQVQIMMHNPKEKAISTGHIPGLRVINQEGFEIVGQGGTSFDGAGNEWNINVIGIDSNIYEKEFPDQWKGYFEGK